MSGPLTITDYQQLPSADQLRADVGPGGRLEFVHAGGTVDVPAAAPPTPDELAAASLRGAVFTACVYLRPTLFRVADEDNPGHVREAVLISRDRYERLVEIEKTATDVCDRWDQLRGRRDA